MKFRYSMHNFTGGRPGLAKVFDNFLHYAKSFPGVSLAAASISELLAGARVVVRTERKRISQSRIGKVRQGKSPIPWEFA